MSTVHSWTGDVEVALAADFDGSLSCLGIELGTENYDMSAPLHSLIQSVSTPEYSEHPENGDTSPSSDSPFSTMESARTTCAAQAKKTRLALSADEEVTSAIKRFCVSSEDKEDSNSSQSSRCRHSSSVPDLRSTGSVLSPSMLSQMLHISDSPPPFSIRDVSKNEGFQYVLGAATSIATKINEETMTYLNQAQSYEIKLKKLGDLTEMRGKMLKSIIRVGFQERRLQYCEREQIAQWQSQRHGERILEIDIPLSYGVYDVVNDPHNIHICEFLWDPTNETGVFVRLNCISTEFTPKKHGGEKGAPFRIQIETFSHYEDYSQRLHVASCQVKVFKPKGADRKHKTDREKMSKKPPSEQDKFKTSYDCTVFIECPADSLYVTTPSTKVSSPENKKQTKMEKSESIEEPREKSPDLFPEVKEEHFPLLSFAVPTASNNISLLSLEATPEETSHWLREHGFQPFVEAFQSFNGLDMARLDREELTLICGTADGIRLHNALRNRVVPPRKTVYVSLANEKAFRALYLQELSLSHLLAKLSLAFHLSLESIHDLQLRGPFNTEIHITDEVVLYIKDEAVFVMDILLEDHSVDAYTLVLKPYTKL